MVGELNAVSFSEEELWIGASDLQDEGEMHFSLLGPGKKPWHWSSSSPNVGWEREKTPLNCGLGERPSVCR